MKIEENILNKECFDIAKCQYKLVSIFKNPSLQEMKECGNNCRSICDKTGNLFIIKFINKLEKILLHRELFDILKSLKLLNGSEENYRIVTNNEILGINLMQKNNTNKIYMGESVELIPSLKNKILRILEKCKDINPEFEFIAESIYTGTEKYKRKSDFIDLFNNK